MPWGRRSVRWRAVAGACRHGPPPRDSAYEPAISEPPASEPTEAAKPRRVFYLPGFDPREPETYWGLFRREARLTAGRRGFVAEVGDPVRSADGHSLDWTIRTVTGGIATETRYSLLRWDDIVRARFPRSNLKRLATVPRLWWRLWRCGYVKALRREARRFSQFIIGVHVIYAVFVAISLAIAALAVSAVSAWAGLGWLSWLAVPLLAYALLGGIMRATRGKPLYVAHLVDDTGFTHEHAAGRDAEMLDRLDAWAERIRAAEPDAAEIVVIGHSSGSFLALEALDRVLARDAEFGRRAVPVTLVTLGSVIAWITLDPLAASTRGCLQRIAKAEAIGWLDLRAVWDWLSIHLRNPLAASGLPVVFPGRPVVRTVRLKDIVEPGSKWGRWNLFRKHFQLLMSSRDPHSFDYIAFVAGPEPVHAMIDPARGQPAPASAASAG